MTSSTNNDVNAWNSLQSKPCKPPFRVWYYEEVTYLHAMDLFLWFHIDLQKLMVGVMKSYWEVIVNFVASVYL